MSGVGVSGSVGGVGALATLCLGSAGFVGGGLGVGGGAGSDSVSGVSFAGVSGSAKGSTGVCGRLVEKFSWTLIVEVCARGAGDFSNEGNNKNPKCANAELSVAAQNSLLRRFSDRLGHASASALLKFAIST
ncbi:hypothetical protein EUZ85_03705 [Hahella sp. KA22]|uniref:hypothetical protein n=1 Tax=Hahella sp. KA22 TaxID=1628392 RepID=UPI000FDD79A0|nr:hypothetical protein [Hahella sp. KA22]AZZ89861.1 hypothetical protein ENC22_01160 [Hahella sp. KA22]QAY53230.1 hypothetical protein EUZ85_03705 [Hahella sp. KA22]